MATISVSSTGIRTKQALRADLRDGAAAMVPWLIGVAPFGLLVGASAAEAGLSPVMALAFGTTIYSGSAQLAATEAAAAGVGLIAATLPVLVLNARLLLYGSSIAPKWQGTSGPYRALAAYLLVDPSYAVGMDGYRAERGHGFYLGGAATLWICWLVTISVGFAVGAAVPPALRLEYAVPLFMLAETVNVARTRPAMAAALASAVITAMGAALPLRSGLLVGVVCGALIGMSLERKP